MSDTHLDYNKLTTEFDKLLSKHSDDMIKEWLEEDDKTNNMNRKDFKKGSIFRFLYDRA